MRICEERNRWLFTVGGAIALNVQAQLDSNVFIPQARQDEDNQEESLAGNQKEGEEQEQEEDWETELSVKYFADVLRDSASTSGGRMGPNYTEKDFECRCT